MTSKLVVNTIEADTGISSVSFASSISLSSTSVFHLGDAGFNIGADTNISRAGNGILAFNINGGEKVRIDSSGNLDIATGQLIISNDIKSSDDDFYVYSYKGGSDGQVRSGIQFDSNSQRLKFFTATNERLQIDTNGYLIAKGDIRLRRTASDNGALYFGDTNNNYIFGSDADDLITFATAGSERVRIASNGGVGINTSDFSSSLNNEVGLAIHGESNDNCRIVLSTPTKSNPPSLIGYYGLNRLGIDCHDGVEIRDVTASYATRFKIDQNGHVTKPAHPSFSARGVGSTFTFFANNNAWYSLGDTVLTNTSYKNDQNFATSHSFGMNRGVLSNGNSCFNADTTVFTAPVDGFYHFCISLYLRASQGGGTCHIGPWINNSNTNIYTYNGSDTTTGDLSYPPATRTIDVKLSAGDTFFWAVYAVGTDKFSIYQDYSYISGYLIG